MREIERANCGIWYKKYSFDDEISPRAYIENILDSDLELKSIRVDEDVDGEMMNYSGAYTKEELKGILDEISSVSSRSSEITINIDAIHNQQEIGLFVGLSSDTFVFVTPDENMSVEDVIKKGKTL